MDGWVDKASSLLLIVHAVLVVEHCHMLAATG